MSDTSTYAGDDDNDEGQTDDQRRDNLKQLREAANEGAKLKRENAFLRAGIDLDPDGPKGKQAVGLFKSYDGPMTVEAIKAEATAWGLLTIEQPDETKPDEPTPAELAQQGFHEGFSGGAPAGGGSTAPPMTSADALHAFHEDRKNGIPLQDAQYALVDRFISEAAEGNKNFLHDTEEWLAQRAAAGFDFTRRGK